MTMKIRPGGVKLFTAVPFVGDNAMSLAELAAFVPAEIERWRTVVKQAGIEMQ